MNRHAFVVGMSLVLLATACATTSALSGIDSLSKSLTSGLGVTSNQAVGGVGSMLSLAQNKLTPGQFEQVAKAIPGAQSSIDTAKSLGAVTGPITDKAGLDSAFSKLGMSPDMVGKFAPVVTDAVSKAGGADVGKLLGGLF